MIGGNYCYTSIENILGLQMLYSIGEASLRGINDSFKKIIIVGNPIKVKLDEDGGRKL